MKAEQFSTQLLRQKNLSQRSYLIFILVYYLSIEVVTLIFFNYGMAKDIVVLLYMKWIIA